MADLNQLYDAILNGDHKTAVTVTRQALTEGTAPIELITNYMSPAMDEVGRRFECEEYFVPELLLSGRAMKAALALLQPLLAASGAEPAGRIVIGTVKGDLHDIGKNLVASMLEGGGFEVHDLGADVAPEKFVGAVREHKPDLVCLSALLTVTMPGMRDVVEALKMAGLRDQVRVMVGGAPVTAEFANEIGADGYAENAGVAVTVARRLTRKNHAMDEAKG
ncbi:MAG: corrinoid protein [Verrucomicrobia bacterium]|nr:corrinoid protein [Verrucomicrobiota bacterium]MBV8274890.1 corrinoid protein [Verrucomicrobiota bacterium]